LQAKLDELEGKDLNESGKAKLELSRIQARLEKAEKEKAELENTWKTEKLNAENAKIVQRLKFLESVPEDARALIVSKEFADIEDRGNTVLMEDRLKLVSQKYAGLLLANVPSGAGTKTGQQTNLQGNRPSLDQVKNTPLSTIAKDPLAYVKQFTAAVDKG